MTDTTIRIACDGPTAADVRKLIAVSDAYMQVLYPPASNHLVDADDLAKPDTVFLTARRDGALLGSIACRLIARGRGITRLSLETGIAQPEAIGLYRSRGYDDCSPFGDYQPDPLSLFMTKSL